MFGRMLRSFAIAGLALAGLVSTASADFSTPDVQNLLTNLAERGDLDTAQAKALAKAQALADKSYKDFPSEVIAYSKVASLLRKAFGSDEEVNAALSQFCNVEGGLTSITYRVVYGENGIGQAAVLAGSSGIKAGLFYGKKVAVPFNKANEESDCVKRLKGWAKALKACAVIFKKYGPK